MEGPIYEYGLTIREYHLDTFGHVNNAAYVQIFEEARWEMITANGYGIDKIQESQLGPVILAMDLKFKREVTNRERVVIRTRCTDYREKIGWLEQVLYKESGQAACLARFTFGLFDMKQRRMAAPTPDWVKAFGLEDRPQKIVS